MFRLSKLPVLVAALPLNVKSCKLPVIDVALDDIPNIFPLVNEEDDNPKAVAVVTESKVKAVVYDVWANDRLPLGAVNSFHLEAPVATVVHVRLPLPSFVNTPLEVCVVGQEYVKFFIFTISPLLFTWNTSPLPTVKREAGVVSPIPTFPVPFGDIIKFLFDVVVIVGVVPSITKLSPNLTKPVFVYIE